MKREIEDFLEGLDAESEARLRAIAAEADEKANAIIAEAEEEAERIIAEAREYLENHVATMRRQLLAQARLESMHTLKSFRSARVRAVFEECRRRLSAIRESAEYPSIFRRLLCEALEALPEHARGSLSDLAAARRLLDELGLTRTLSPDEIERACEKLLELRKEPGLREQLERALASIVARDSSEVVVHVDPRDETLALDTLRNTGYEARVAPDIETAGGVIVSTADENVVIRNTLESRLERAIAHLGEAVDAILFPGAGE
jgi:V/A-type H+-transporting ATPase subunit E